MMVVYEEYFCIVITYGIILSCFRCLVVSTLVRMWRRLRFLWMLIYVGPFVLLRGYSETLSVFTSSTFYSWFYNTQRGCPPLNWIG
jgi:hypothetical protein